MKISSKLMISGSALTMALMSASSVYAHASAIGWSKGAAPGSVNLFMGSYHGNAGTDSSIPFEGAAQLIGPAGSGYDVTSSFTTGYATNNGTLPPSLLVQNVLLASGWNLSSMVSWQAVTMTGLATPGVYNFNYICVGCTAFWTPLIGNTSFNLSADDLSGGGINVGAPTIPDIDTAVVAYTTTQLSAGAVNPNFVGGTLQLLDAGTVTTNFTIQTQGGTIDTNGFGAEFNGLFSGAGSLTKDGAGALLLTGVNTYTGGTFINAGTLVLGNNNAFGTGQVTLGAGGTLRTNADNLVLNNNLTISNANIDTGSYSFTLNGVVDGAGSLIKIGGGTLVLGGANLYTGGTVLRAGTIQVNTNTALGTGDLAMENGTTLRAGASNLTLGNAIALVGGGATVDVTGQTLTLGGTLYGTGSLSVVNTTAAPTAVLVLNGANTYSGGTYVMAGATVQIADAMALGTGTLNLVGTDTVSATLNVTGTTTIGNAITVAGDPTFNIATGTTTTINGLISDGATAGDVVVNNDGVSTGTLVLNGANTYTGGTVLKAGAITVGNNSALGTGTLAMARGTTLTAGANGLVVGNEIAMKGANTIDTGANNFTLSGTLRNADLSGGIFVGAWQVDQGPSWSGSPPNGPLAYTGQEAAALLFGGQPGDYVISTAGSDPSLINNQAWYSIIGYGAEARAQDYVSKYLGLYYGPTSGYGFDAGQPASAYVRDNANGPNYTNYAFLGPVPGQLIKIGSGTLILQGDNSYSGGTLLNAGTIQVEHNNALGTGALTMADGTTLAAGIDGLVLANAITTLGVGTIDTAANSFTLNGVIDGAGSLTKIGTGTLVLNGANSYSGGTSLDNGAITVGNNSALGTGTLTMAAGTTLNAGADGLVVANNITINTSGTINTGANTFTLAGTIGNGTGIGLVGQWRVDQGPSWSGSPPNGPLAYTGQEAAALLFGGQPADYSISTAGTDVGQINYKAWYSIIGYGSAELAQDYVSKYLGAYYGPTSGYGSDAGQPASAYVRDNANGPSFTNYAFGMVTLPSTLVKSGAGTLILQGSNSYSGGTLLNAGTVQVQNNNALGTGALTMADGTTLAAGTDGLVLANAITTLGIGTIDTAANSFTLNGVIDGAGSLTKIGTGTLVLNGANSYSGGTSLAAGTIRVGNNAALGTGALGMAAGTTLQAGATNLSVGNAIGMLGGASIDVNGQVLTLRGVISGTGPLSVLDSASLNSDALILTGVNTYTGGTVVTGTTVQISQDANLGNVAGGVTLVGSTLRTTASLSTARSVVLGAGGGSFDVATGTTLTSTGVISGTSLAKNGAGLLVLNGTNTYTGGTALNAGAITVGTNAALGTGTLTMAGGTTLTAGVTGLTTANAIAVAGAATINSGASPSVYTLSGVISGAGSVTKQGTGQLNLTGASTYTGATTVAAGTLNVTGSLASAVTVNSGATLTGTGTVGALNVLAGASVAPGAPGTTDIATLRVTGAATLAGTYTVNVATVTNDRITAGGALTVGGTLAVQPVVPGTFATFNQIYTVASGSSRTGSFATVTGLGNFGIAFAPVVEYTTTQANIRLAPNSLVAIGNLYGGLDGNPLEAAKAFDRAVALGYNPQAFFAVYANAGSNLSRTLREMSGEQRATERRVVLESNRVFRETALDRLNLGLASMAGQQVSTSSGDSSLTFWMRGAGSWGKAQTSGAATGFRTEQLGVLTGIDWARDNLTVGGMFHYTTTDVTFSYLGGSSRVETVGGTVYAGWRQKDAGFVFNAGASVSGARTSGARAITLTGFGQTLTGRTTGTTYQVFGELAYDLAKGADTRIEPFVRNTYVTADMNALTETGGVAALAAPNQTNNINVFNAGMRFATTLQGGKYSLNGSASWQRTSGDREAATFIGIPAVGQFGNIRSVAIDADALLLQVGAGAKLSEKIRFSLDYAGQYGKNNSDHGARATLNVAF